MGRVDNSKLERWREIDSSVVLRKISSFAKQDNTYKPVKSNKSTRWHARVDQREFELLLTGPKFWDTRERTGGAGGIDLVMHLLGLPFTGAVRVLQEAQL